MMFKLLLDWITNSLIMSFGVDTLGELNEKLKKLVNETQDHYESLVGDVQLYKKGKMKIGEREFSTKIANYMISLSALNFLAIRVILEIKSAMDKGSSIKNSTGGMAQPVSGSGFGIGSFVDSSSGSSGDPTSSNNQYVMPEPQPTEPKFKPVDITINPEHKDQNSKKNCIKCGSSIPLHAKFCPKCGNSQ